MHGTNQQFVKLYLNGPWIPMDEFLYTCMLPEVEQLKRTDAYSQFKLNRLQDELAHIKK